MSNRVKPLSIEKEEKKAKIFKYFDAMAFDLDDFDNLPTTYLEVKLTQ